METGKEEKMREALTTSFGEKMKEIVIKRLRRMFVTVEPRDLIPVMEFLQSSWGMTHLSTISSRDHGERLEALYHLNDGAISLTMRASAPTAHPHLPTVTTLYPGAEWYEREISGLLGFVIEGLPKGRGYPLPEGWPEGVYPLRKSWSPEANRSLQGLAGVKGEMGRSTQSDSATPLPQESAGGVSS